MPETPSGAVQLLDQAANIPLPLMIVNAMDAVVAGANILNQRYQEVLHDWLADGAHPPAPVQVAFVKAALDLTVTLSFSLDQTDSSTKATSLGISASSGPAISKWIKFNGTFATSTNESHVNKFNLSGEFATKIHIEMAAVFAPAASGT